jgi:hypothetical protein
MNVFLTGREIGIGIALGSLSLAACKDEGFRDVPAEEAPQTFADVVCGQAESCGCFEDLDDLNDFDTCKAEYEAQLRFVIEAGAATGLTYDGTCIGRYLDLTTGLGCKTDADDHDFWDECRWCSLFHGHVAVGEPCEQLAGEDDEDYLFDDCAQGLYCVGGMCRDPCSTAGEGDDCRVAACAEGLYCGWEWDPETDEESATCRRWAQQGENCEERHCANGLVCDWETSTCEPLPPRPGIGEPCPEGLCVDEAYCDTSDPDAQAWTCHARKGEGQPCEQSQECLNYSCEDGACAPDLPLVCFFF